MIKIPVVWSIALTVELFLYGSLVSCSILKNWNNPKKPHKANEIVMAVLYFAFGLAVPFIYIQDNLSPELENRLFMYTYLFLLALDIFWWGGNIIPNHLKCKKDPELKANRCYDDFEEYLTENHTDTAKRDFSRKFNHVFLWAILIGFFVYSSLHQSKVEIDWGFENKWAFCKFFYILFAFGFLNMFVVEDTIRTNAFHALPPWANKWLKTSLNPKELYTYISSIPYVLTLAMLIFLPYQIIFVATAVSTFGDAAASIFGKAYGKHKYPKQFDNKKSFEGLTAGTFFTFIAVLLTLVFFPFPNNDSIFFVLTISIGCALIFAAIDVFWSKDVSDNITNNFWPALFTYSMALAFGAF